MLYFDLFGQKAKIGQSSSLDLVVVDFSRSTCYQWRMISDRNSLTFSVE